MILPTERSYLAPLSDEIVIEDGPGLVHVCLNRPTALNALSTAMFAGLERALDMASGRPILLRGEGRAFCAGGDIKAQALAIRAGALDGPAEYFAREYGFNARLFAYQGEYVSYLNGIAMGGGYGVSAHGSHVVTCEATQFAMPEVKIGFFPDVGAVYHLARVADELGTYVALTGNTVQAADMHMMGLAQAHIPLAQYDRLRARLAVEPVGDVLADMHEAPPPGMLAPWREVIARCFAFDEAEAIIDALRHEGSDFAVATADEIAARSPTSVKVALAHIRRARRGDFATVIARDLRLALAFLQIPDFPEGVRAAVIDKDRRPQWSPRLLADVTDAAVALYLGEDGD